MTQERNDLEGKLDNKDKLDGPSFQRNKPGCQQASHSPDSLIAAQCNLSISFVINSKMASFIRTADVEIPCDKKTTDIFTLLVTLINVILNTYQDNSR